MVVSLPKQFAEPANDIKQLSEKVDAINALEPTLEVLSDYELRARTKALRQRIANGETKE
ncbi:MAG: hypothetical protein HKN28_00755 [Alphaproteobacteria bacterium]|nr:hypothetical protein [Alphaproteobacteria bacterium]